MSESLRSCNSKITNTKTSTTHKLQLKERGFITIGGQKFIQYIIIEHIFKDFNILYKIHDRGMCDKSAEKYPLIFSDKRARNKYHGKGWSDEVQRLKKKVYKNKHSIGRENQYEVYNANTRYAIELSY